MIPCLEIVLQYSLAVRTVLARTQEGSFDTSVNIRGKVYIRSRAGKLLRGVSKKRGKQQKVSLGGLFVIVKVVSAISIFASFFVRCLTSLKRGEIFFGHGPTIRSCPQQRTHAHEVGLSFSKEQMEHISLSSKKRNLAQSRRLLPPMLILLQRCFSRFHACSHLVVGDSYEVVGKGKNASVPPAKKNNQSPERGWKIDSGPLTRDSTSVKPGSFFVLPRSI